MSKYSQLEPWAASWMVAREAALGGPLVAGEINAAANLSQAISLKRIADAMGAAGEKSLFEQVFGK